MDERKVQLMSYVGSQGESLVLKDQIQTMKHFRPQRSEVSVEQIQFSAKKDGEE